MTEVLKDVIGYEGLYEVSNKGVVYGRKRNNILKFRINHKGYCQLSLCKDNKKKETTIHRLVAIAFLPNPKNKPQVNHIDGNKQNNNVENLEWNTPKENIIHAYKTGLVDKTYLKQKIKCIFPDGTEKQYEAVDELLKDLNVSRATVCNTIAGKYKNKKGHKYVYIH